MTEDIKDKQFIALELTKVLFNDKCKYTPEQVYKAYSYFLLTITGLTDDISTVTSLKEEITKLLKENERLKADNRDPLKRFSETLLKVLEDCKGDMEPYVYKALYDLLYIPRV